MSSSSNIIDLAERRKLKKLSVNSEISTEDAPVIDMVERREAMLLQERRIIKRTILTEFIGVHLIIPGLGLQKCAIHDISETGIAFDLDLFQGQFSKKEKVAMRVYLNPETYFTFIVEVLNVREIKDEGVYRHGCALQPDSVNEEALYHFVKFIENVSARLKTDHGDISVSKI